MNKKGQNAFFLLSMFIVFFVLGLALTPPLTDTTNKAMNSSQLNCSNSSISDQNKAVCTSIEIFPFLFLATLFGLGGILAGAIIK